MYKPIKITVKIVNIFFYIALIQGCATNANNLSENDQVACIENGRCFFNDIDNPTEKVQIAAVSSTYSYIKDIRNPSLAVQSAAIKKDCSALNHIKNPTLELHLAVASQGYVCARKYILMYNKNPLRPPIPEPVQIALAEENPHDMHYVPNLTKKAMIATLKSHRISRNYDRFLDMLESHSAFKAMSKRDRDEIRVIAITEDPKSIKHVVNPSVDLQLLAVNQEDSAVRYIRKPSPRVLSLPKVIAYKKAQAARASSYSSSGSSYSSSTNNSLNQRNCYTHVQQKCAGGYCQPVHEWKCD